MGHTKQTPNYNLPQFEQDDVPGWLTDVNGAFSAIDTGMGENRDSAEVLAGQMEQAKSDIVKNSSDIEGISVGMTGMGNELDDLTQRLADLNTLAQQLNEKIVRMNEDIATLTQSDTNLNESIGAANSRITNIEKYAQLASSNGAVPEIGITATSTLAEICEALITYKNANLMQNVHLVYWVNQNSTAGTEVRNDLGNVYGVIDMICQAKTVYIVFKNYSGAICTFAYCSYTKENNLNRLSGWTKLVDFQSEIDDIAGDVSACEADIQGIYNKYIDNGERNLVSGCGLYVDGVSIGLSSWDSTSDKKALAYYNHALPYIFSLRKNKITDGTTYGEFSIGTGDNLEKVNALYALQGHDDNSSDLIIRIINRNGTLNDLHFNFEVGASTHISAYKAEPNQPFVACWQI